MGAGKPQAAVGDGDSLDISLDRCASAKIRLGSRKGEELPQVEAPMTRVLDSAASSLRHPEPFDEKCFVVGEPQGVVHRGAGGHAVRKPLAAGKRVVRAIELQANPARRGWHLGSDQSRQPERDGDSDERFHHSGPQPIRANVGMV